MGKLGNLAGQTKNNVDAQLKDQEAQLLLATSGKLEQLRPRVSDKESFDKLLAAVAESTAKNESVAAFQQRVQSLGASVASIAKTVSGLIP